MDRGAWQATVHRVTQSWIWLKRLSTHVLTSQHKNLFNPSEFWGFSSSLFRLSFCKWREVLCIYIEKLEPLLTCQPGDWAVNSVQVCTMIWLHYFQTMSSTMLCQNSLFCWVADILISWQILWFSGHFH